MSNPNQDELAAKGHAKSDWQSAQQTIGCLQSYAPPIVFFRMKVMRESGQSKARDDFLLHEEDFGKVVVHGYTPAKEPDIGPNRINIDTGAYATGRLACPVLEGNQMSFIRNACSVWGMTTRPGRSGPCGRECSDEVLNVRHDLRMRHRTLPSASLSWPSPCF